MPDSASDHPLEDTNSDLWDPEPLTVRQRAAAAAIGGVLAGAGGIAVFISKNQVGSGILLFAGAVFLLVAVSGMPLLGARFQEFELRLAWRRRQSALQAAARLPTEESRRLLEIINEVHPGSTDDPFLSLIESLLFEGRVTDAVIAAAERGEQIESHPGADVGEPLLDWISQSGDTRIGVFAMFVTTETVTVSQALSDQFLQRLPRAEYDALVWVTCARNEGDLTTLAARVQRELGLPVAIEVWARRDSTPSLRPAIDRLTAQTRASAMTEARAPRQTHAEPGSATNE
ncbi:hypothetical protein M2164_000155 [Streptomyces sp. SAI-208]|uniref:hypothetical protein n=1 Tax=Streptomyces sp. SAI-208 TaxID=2940550 RepID=UPI0024763AED|nr:hypothetical protein [Streptomyces sp. SAI-208]MDH6604520.1 hypothetical protein [Streptomyces sp. SAI-208]